MYPHELDGIKSTHANALKQSIRAFIFRLFTDDGSRVTCITAIARLSSLDTGETCP